MKYHHSGCVALVLAMRLQDIEDLRAALRPFAAIPPVDAETAAHYWCVIGSPGKSHFTRHDLERASNTMDKTAP